MMWVGTYDQFAFCNLRSFDVTLLFYTSKTFCKASNGTSNATKFVQIDESLSKICFLQVKGVMGM